MSVKDRPLVISYWGGGGGRGGRAKYKKEIFAQEKIKWKKKIHARQLTLKNIHAKA